MNSQQTEKLLISLWGHLNGCHPFGGRGWKGSDFALSSPFPLSLLVPVWSLGCLSTLQRIAEREGPGQCGPGALGIPGHLSGEQPSLPLPWPVPSAPFPPGEGELGFAGLGSCRRWAPGTVQTRPLWQKGTRLLSSAGLHLAFLRGFAPKLSHLCVLERCFQPPDPTWPDPSSEDLSVPVPDAPRAPCWHKHSVSTKLPQICISWGAALCTDYAGLVFTTHLHCPHTSEALLSAQCRIKRWWHVAPRDHVPRSERERKEKKCIFNLPVNLLFSTLSIDGMLVFECEGREANLL